LLFCFCSPCIAGMTDPNARFQATPWRDVPWAIVWLIQLVLTLAASVYAIIALIGDYNPNDRQQKVAMGLGWMALGIAIAVVNAVVVLVLIRKFPLQFIYVCNVAYICLLVALAVWSFFVGSLFAGILLLVVACFYALWFRSVRSRIPFAALVLKSASAITAKYPSMMLLAGLMFVVTSVYCVLFLFLILLCERIAGLWVLLAFLFFWTGEVFQNVVYTTCCGVAASWYFLRDGVSNPTLGAFRRTMTTSFGSVCFGSLLVAILKTIRLLLRMMMEKASDTGACGMVAMCILCCVEALVGMIESLLEYFNEYAYAQIAIYGKKYTTAAKDTIQLLKQSGMLAIINDMLINPVLVMTSFFSGILVALIVGLLSRSVLYGFFGFLIGLYMCSMCLSTVRACVVTLFVCYAEQPQALLINDPDLYTALTATAQGLPRPSAPQDPVATDCIVTMPPAAAPCTATDVPYGQPVPPAPAYGQLPPSSYGQGPPPPYAPAPAPSCGPVAAYGQAAPPPYAPHSAPSYPSAGAHQPTGYPTSVPSGKAPPPTVPGWRQSSDPSEKSHHPPPSTNPPPDYAVVEVPTVPGADGPLCVGLQVRVQRQWVLEGGPQDEGPPDQWLDGIVELAEPATGTVGIRFTNGCGGMAIAGHVYMV